MPATPFPQHWIFLRGLGRQSLHWRGFPEQFRQAFRGTLVETLDTAGNGSEAGRKSFLRIEQYTADLRQRSRCVTAGKAPFGILAISMGAMVAAAWAQHNPGEVSHMVLINTSSRTDSRFYQRLRWRHYGTMMGIMARNGNALFRERSILRMTARGLPDWQGIAQEFAGMTATAPANLFRQLLASSRYSFPERPGCPVLFLASERDEMVDPACTRSLAARWQAPLRCYRDAGHDLPLTAPGWVIDQVKAFAALSI